MARSSRADVPGAGPRHRADDVAVAVVVFDASARTRRAPKNGEARSSASRRTRRTCWVFSWRWSASCPTPRSRGGPASRASGGDLRDEPTELAALVPRRRWRVAGGAAEARALVARRPRGRLRPASPASPPRCRRATRLVTPFRVQRRSPARIGSVGFCHARSAFAAAGNRRPVVCSARPGAAFSCPFPPRPRGRGHPARRGVSGRRPVPGRRDAGSTPLAGGFCRAVHEVGAP